MTASALPPWVIIPLAETMDAPTLCQRAQELGVPLELTQDGLALPGFLGWLDAPPSILDRSVTKGRPETDRLALYLSGGTNEPERFQHRAPREQRAEFAEQMRAVSPPPKEGAGIESGASRKMTGLTEYCRALLPLARGVVIPHANNVVLDPQEFATRATELLDQGGSTYPLWSYLVLREDQGGPHLASTGMWPFALPELGMALPNGDVQRAVGVLGALRREMVAEGWWPLDGERRKVRDATADICAVLGSVWVNLDGVAEDALAKIRFARLSCMQAIVGACTHHRAPARDGHPAIEHFLRGRESLAITNGLSDRVRPGGHLDQGGLVELMLNSPKLGPWGDFWLKWAAASISQSGPERPVKPLRPNRAGGAARWRGRRHSLARRLPQTLWGAEPHH